MHTHTQTCTNITNNQQPHTLPCFEIQNPRRFLFHNLCFYNDILVFSLGQQQTSMSVSQTGASEVYNKEISVFVTLSLVLLCYFICFVPQHIFIDIYFFGNRELLTLPVFLFGLWMSYMNSTINPLLYAYSNRYFREAFKKMFKICGCK